MTRNEHFDLKSKVEDHFNFLRAKILTPFFFLWLSVLSLNVMVLVIMEIFRSVGFNPDVTIQSTAVVLVLFSGVVMFFRYLIPFAKVVKKEGKIFSQLLIDAGSDKSYEDCIPHDILYKFI